MGNHSHILARIPTAHKFLGRFGIPGATKKICLSLVFYFSVMTAPKKSLRHHSALHKARTQNMTLKRLSIEPLPSTIQVFSENSTETSNELATAEHNLN
jgi:hypothetical protein